VCAARAALERQSGGAGRAGGSACLCLAGASARRGARREPACRHRGARPARSAYATKNEEAAVAAASSVLRPRTRTRNRRSWSRSDS
jgi:hypothetical protein